MALADDIQSTQHFVHAAEAFVEALGEMFPDQRFAEFFHESTLQRAYWTALQQVLRKYTTPARALFVDNIMRGMVFANALVVRELLKLFLPGQTPDYLTVAELWEDVLDPEAEAMIDSLVLEVEMVFTLLANELRQSPDLRLALQQLSQVRRVPLLPPWEAANTAEQDLSRLLDAALISGPSTISLQVRHLMSLTSERVPVSGTATTLELRALAQLAERLSPQGLQVIWQRARALDDVYERLRILSQLAPFLSREHLIEQPLTLVQEAFAQGPAPVPPALRVEVLLRLAPHLATPNRGTMPSFQQRVLDGAQTIDDAASRVRALGALIPYLPADLQREAVMWAFEAAAYGISSESARAEALSVLPPHLPLEFQERLFDLAYDLETPEARALLLGRMIPYLPPSLQSQALIGALHAIEQIAGDDARTQALIALAPYVDAVGPLQYLPEGLRQVIEVTFSIEYADDRARAFAALAPYLSPELLGEALHATRDIEDDYDRAVTLTKLAPHLPSDLQVAAFGIAQELRPAQARATALAAIAPYLSMTARQQALADALAAALAIEDRYDRVVALADLAPHLPDELRGRALHEAMIATRSIRDESERGRALVFLAPHLLAEHLPDALADAYTIQDPMERTPPLSALMPRMPEEPRRRVGQDAIKSAMDTRLPYQRASILASVAPVLPDDLLPLAVEVAKQIDPPYDRMHVLTALLSRAPHQLHDAALAAAYDVPNRYQRTNALLELLPHTSPALRQPILDEALDTALRVEDDYDRASALAHLAPYLDAQTDVQNQQQDALHLALLACLEVEDAVERAALLRQLADVWSVLLTPAQSYLLWREVVLFLRSRLSAETLSDLAALAPVIEKMGAPHALDAVVDKLLAELSATQ
jgi:hypothetical protein